MKINIRKNQFLNSLNIVSKALPSNTTYPILECILIDATKKNIILTTTDSEISIKTILDGEIEEPGKIAIEGKFLYDIIKGMPESEDNILLKVDNNNNCKISSGKIVNKFIGKNAEDFPNITNYSKEKFIKISEYLLKKMIEKSLIAVSRDKKETRIISKGVYVVVDKDKITFNALDSYKMAIINQKLNEQYEKMTTFIPGTTLDELLKIIKGDIDKEVKIYFNDNNVTFELNNTILISRIINSKYVDIKNFINKEYNTKVTVNRKDLIESLERTNPYIYNVERKPVNLEIKDEELTISLQSIRGDYKDELKIVKNGNDLLIPFNQEQLNSILKVIDDEEITMYFNLSKDPLVIKDLKENYLYLIMSFTNSK